MIQLSDRDEATLHLLVEESIYILREAAGQFERPAILFSGGKDSIVLAHLARLAFAPTSVPMPLLHVDTGHNYPEVIRFRDEFVAKHGFRLEVRLVQDTIDQGRVVEERGPRASRNGLQSVTLMDAIKDLRLDCAIGGARRDEEKARAKERMFSLRDGHGAWDPKNQRPELFRHLNGAKMPEEHFRVFPLSNWTEMDIWRFILTREIQLPSIYFAHERLVFERDGVLYGETEHMKPYGDEKSSMQRVRFRTVGDATCTGAMRSDAKDVLEVVQEVSGLRVSERAGRGDDRRSDSAMEDRKKAGYF